MTRLKTFFLIVTFVLSLLLLSYVFTTYFKLPGTSEKPYAELYGFPYLGEEEVVRYRDILEFEKRPLTCREQGGLEALHLDNLLVQYYCIMEHNIVELPVRNLTESKILRAIPYPALRSPVVYLVKRWVIRVNFTLPSNMTLGVYRDRYSPPNATDPYFFSVRFGLPYCFEANTSQIKDLTLRFEHYVLINNKKFPVVYTPELRPSEGVVCMWTGIRKVCGEPFTPTFLYVSEDELRNINYEVLKLLKPGDTITLEFVIELYMSKEQAESATGYIGLVLAYPYIEIQYPRKSP